VTSTLFRSAHRWRNRARFTFPLANACPLGHTASLFFASHDLAIGAQEFREIRRQLRCCNWIQIPTMRPGAYSQFLRQQK
jgi:hypothetical protein